MGATYTILNASSSTAPVVGDRCMPISWSIVSIATFVLPAPVGAQMSIFSAEYSAHLHTRDCTRLSERMPANAGCAHSGSESIGTSASPSKNGFGLSAGMCTSSYPLRWVRTEPAGSAHFLFAIRWPPCSKASASRSSTVVPTRALVGSGIAARRSAAAASAPSAWARIRDSSAVSLRTRASSCFVWVKISSVCLRALASSWTTAAVASCVSNSASRRARSASDCACARRVQHPIFQRCLSSSRMNSNLS